MFGQVDSECVPNFENLWRFHLELYRRNKKGCQNSTLFLSTQTLKLRLNYVWLISLVALFCFATFENGIWRKRQEAIQFKTVVGFLCDFDYKLLIHSRKRPRWFSGRVLAYYSRDPWFDPLHCLPTKDRKIISYVLVRRERFLIQRPNAYNYI